MKGVRRIKVLGQLMAALGCLVAMVLSIVAQLSGTARLEPAEVLLGGLLVPAGIILWAGGFILERFLGPSAGGGG